jgi:hypothetical protein
VASGHVEYRDDLHAAQTPRRAGSDARRNHPGTATQARRCARYQGLPAESAGDPHRRPDHGGTISIHPAGHRSRRTLSVDADAARPDSPVAGIRRCHQQSQQPEPRCRARHRSRQTVRAWPDFRPGRGCFAECFQRAPDFNDLRGDQPVPGDSRSCSRVSGRSDDAFASLRSWYRRQAGAARHDRPYQSQDAGADCQSPGAAASGDHFLQPLAGRLARRGGRPHQGAGTGPELAGIAEHEPAGNGAGLPVVPAGAGCPPADRRPGGLSGSRHSLRELRAPLDHPFRFARRRPRCAVDALDLQRGSEPLRLRWRHHADRHRQEERNHDDRLRARSATQ